MLREDLYLNHIVVTHFTINDYIQDISSDSSCDKIQCCQIHSDVENITSVLSSLYIVYVSFILFKIVFIMRRLIYDVWGEYKHNNIFCMSVCKICKKIII